MGIAKYFRRKSSRVGKLVRMDRLRRSLRESFRRKKEHVPECSKPHQWQADEAAVRAGTCSFSVKYLGCVEVFESRGMQVCEEALKVLRNSRRRPVKGILYVTGDGLRVVEDETKGLIVDQTIEKVSFCAPDRNHDKGFSYICRDGTTRRWMCHGFLAVKDSGERLSHAVGCAFAACLERKQKRDKECGVTMTFDPNNATFTRTGSFRQSSLTDRMQDPQDCKPAEPPPVKAVHNPYAIERPHATPMMLQRQGSFRGFSHLGQSSPFKRQLSLRLNELPSTLERQRSLSLESSDFSQRNGPVSPILENAPVADKQESISALCQQVTQGLTLLSNAEDPFVTSQSQRFEQQGTRVHDSFDQSKIPSSGQSYSQITPATTMTSQQFIDHPIGDKYIYASQNNYSIENNITSHVTGHLQQLHQNNQLNQQNLGGQTYTVSTTMGTSYISNTSNSLVCKPFQTTENAHQTNPWLNNDAGSEVVKKSSAAEEWLASAGSVPRSSSNPSDLVVGQIHAPLQDPALLRRAPNLVHLRSQSLGEGQMQRTEPWLNGTARDPFDAEWAALATRSQASTNPFQQNSMKAFEVQL